MTAENGNLRENYLSITGLKKEKKDITNYILSIVNSIWWFVDVYYHILILFIF